MPATCTIAVRGLAPAFAESVKFNEPLPCARAFDVSVTQGVLENAYQGQKLPETPTPPAPPSGGNEVPADATDAIHSVRLKAVTRIRNPSETPLNVGSKESDVIDMPPAVVPAT